MFDVYFVLGIIYLKHYKSDLTSSFYFTLIERVLRDFYLKIKIIFVFSNMVLKKLNTDLFEKLH